MYSSPVFQCLILEVFGSLFRSLVMCFVTRNILKELNFCLYELVCGKIGFAVCRFLEVTVPKTLTMMLSKSFLLWELLNHLYLMKSDPFLKISPHVGGSRGRTGFLQSALLIYNAFFTMCRDKNIGCSFTLLCLSSHLASDSAYLAVRYTCHTWKILSVLPVLTHDMTSGSYRILANPLFRQSLVFQANNALLWA